MASLDNFMFGTEEFVWIYLLLGRNMDPSMNTEPDSSIYQQVLNSPWLKYTTESATKKDNSCSRQNFNVIQLSCIYSRFTIWKLINLLQDNLK